MKINWFPGHMTKALRMMQEEVKNIDVIIYVLDARAPKSCFNPSFYSIVEGKPILFILNKSDLCDEKDIKNWINYFTNKNHSCIALNSTQSGSTKLITDMLRKLCCEKIEKYKSKGLNIRIRSMIIGVPNSGKSTLINNMVGIKKAITGNKPGVTKGKQLIALRDGVDLLDTPGTLWPSFEDQNIARNLVFIGSIKDDVVDINDVGIELVSFLKNNYPNNLMERYKLETLEKENYEILEDIAVQRKFLLKGNEIDFERTSHSILDDFRKGRLGKIILDKADV